MLEVAVIPSCKKILFWLHLPVMWIGKES